VDKGGQTLSATGFAALTGVSRERLRTWERRYGFPRPQRAHSGPRRYAVADAGAVVDVRRAAEEGVPLPHAIAAARASARQTRALSRGVQASIAEQLPAPVAVLSGPEPLRIEYVNPALATRSGAPRPGDELISTLAWFAGSECERALRTVFSNSEQALECAHPAWWAADEEVHSLVYGLPSHAGSAPLVALVQLERPRERETKQALARSVAERGQIDARLDRHERWLGAIAELAELFQRESGTALLQATAETIVQRLPPIDAGVAVYMGGELALGSSSRGRLGPRMVTVTAHTDLATVLRERKPEWLTPASAAAFGAASGLHVLAVPVAVLAETLGVLLLVTDATAAIDDEVSQVLTVLSALIGFALLRDRLVEGAR
jgi:DNA-binding transcriptional MerR regulator